MRRYRNCKIVATVGPATCDYDNIERLFLSGVDIFRLNFSHGSHDVHASYYNNIMAVGKNHHAYPTILADLQGPKLRVGMFENDKIILEDGDIFRFDLDPTPGNTKRVNLPHIEILEALCIGTTLLLDDGKLSFEVVDCGSDYADVKVLVGGCLSNKKGVNVPHVMLPIPALTEKDKKDLDFALHLGVDWVALSFVQNVDDVEEAKKIINGRARVMSKLEKPLAIKALDPIVEASDAIMVARGDLGVEMKQEELPRIQREIISACHRIGRPVVVATQMLESMICSPSPTRAEVSDVATAIYSGADAVMLSAETASGKYPFESVNIMDKVIQNTEADPSCIFCVEDNSQLPIHSVVDAICNAAKQAAEYSDAAIIVQFADTIDAIARCSRMRPRCPILAVVSNHELARKAGVYNGVYAVIYKQEFAIENICKNAKAIAAERYFAKIGDNIVVLNHIAGNSVHVCKL